MNVLVPQVGSSRASDVESVAALASAHGGMLRV
jgi:hypothetical protein